MKAYINIDNLTLPILFALIDHFNYSIKDINSYEELTDIEKLLISKDIFDKLTYGCKN